MKMSIVKGLFLFIAGAGCATVVAQIYPDPISPGQWQERGNKALVEIAALGLYVNVAAEGRVSIAPYACSPPPIPKQPAGTVDPRLLERGLLALHNLNAGYYMGDKAPVFAVERCKPLH